jgi:sulfonate transport system ATP-binding protein
MTGVPISARGLAKSFGAKRVLHGVDLDAPAGQFLAVVGKSGCGKSTLLRLIQGLESPTEGRLDAGPDPAARRIMFQEPRLLPWLKVVENVEVGLPAMSDRRALRRGAEEALALVGLADRGGDWPAALSGGQRQRVALARALVSRPRLLCLDEPLGALDALTRIEMQGLLERVWTEQGFTAVLVTHDVAEAVALGDRVLLIDAGHVSLDLMVDLPRPRRRGDPALAELEGRVLGHLFGDDAHMR